MQTVPLPIIEHIASHLDPVSYSYFSQVSKLANLACKSDAVCLLIYENHLGAPLSEYQFVCESYKSLLTSAWKEVIKQSKLSNFTIWMVQKGHYGLLKQVTKLHLTNESTQQINQNSKTVGISLENHLAMMMKRSSILRYRRIS